MPPPPAGQPRWPGAGARSTASPAPGPAFPSTGPARHSPSPGRPSQSPKLGTPGMDALLPKPQARGFGTPTLCHPDRARHSKSPGARSFCPTRETKRPGSPIRPTGPLYPRAPEPGLSAPSAGLRAWRAYPGEGREYPGESRVGLWDRRVGVGEGRETSKAAQAGNASGESTLRTPRVRAAVRIDGLSRTTEQTTPPTCQPFTPAARGNA